MANHIRSLTVILLGIVALAVIAFLTITYQPQADTAFNYNSPGVNIVGGSTPTPSMSPYLTDQQIKQQAEAYQLCLSTGPTDLSNDAAIRRFYDLRDRCNNTYGILDPATDERSRRILAYVQQNPLPTFGSVTPEEAYMNCTGGKGDSATDAIKRACFDRIYGGLVSSSPYPAATPWDLAGVIDDNTSGQHSGRGESREVPGEGAQDTPTAVPTTTMTPYVIAPPTNSGSTSAISPSPYVSPPQPIKSSPETTLGGTRDSVPGGKTTSSPTADMTTNQDFVGSTSEGPTGDELAKLKDLIKDTPFTVFGNPSESNTGSTSADTTYMASTSEGPTGDELAQKLESIVAEVPATLTSEQIKATVTTQVKQAQSKPPKVNQKGIFSAERFQEYMDSLDKNQAAYLRLNNEREQLLAKREAQRGKRQLGAKEAGDFIEGVGRKFGFLGELVGGSLGSFVSGKDPLVANERAIKRAAENYKDAQEAMDKEVAKLVRQCMNEYGAQSDDIDYVSAYCQGVVLATTQGHYNLTDEGMYYMYFGDLPKEGVRGYVDRGIDWYKKQQRNIKRTLGLE